MLETRVSGTIYHRSGIRRSPEELRHTAAKKPIDISENEVTIEDGYYRCMSKNISIKEPKLCDFCLKPGAKHSKEFFDIGYSQDNPKKLFEDMAEQFNISKKYDSAVMESGVEKFSIPMKLGITGTYQFRTVWMSDGPDNSFRFITSFVDRKLKQEDN